MARQQGRQLTPRTQMDPRETFDYTTPDIHVRATPVSSYRQTDVSSGYSSLIKALSGVNSGLQAFMGASVADKQADYVEGQESFKKGQELAPGSPEAMVIGYERLRGQSSAKQYEKDLSTNLKANARYMTQQDFDKFMSDTAGKYTQGATEHFLAGFFDGGALAMETNANAYYTEVRQAQMREDALDMAVTTANIFVESTLESSLGVDYIELVDNPTLYQGLQKDVDDVTGKTFFQNTAEQLRAELTLAQEAAKLQGIPAKEVTTAYITAIGENAVEYGMPELLDFATLKDKHGISLLETGAFEKLKAYKKAATKTRNLMKDNFEYRLQKEKEIRINEKLNNWSVELSDISSIINPVEIATRTEELKKRIQNDEDFLGMPYTQVNAINNVLSNLTYLSQQAPRVSDVDTIQDLQTKWLFGDITATEVNEAFTRQLLSQSDYSSLMKGIDTLEQRKIADQKWRMDWDFKVKRAQIADNNTAWSRRHMLEREAKADAEKKRLRAEQAKRDKEKKRLTFPDKDLCYDLHNDIRRHISMGPRGKIDNKKLTRSTALLNDGLREFITKNGRYPTHTEYVRDVAEPVLNKYNTNMADLLEGNPPKTKDSRDVDISEDRGWAYKLGNFLQGKGWTDD